VKFSTFKKAGKRLTVAIEYKEMAGAGGAEAKERGIRKRKKVLMGGGGDWRNAASDVW